MSLTNNHLSTREFAEKAGVSPSTVSKWLRSGKIEGQKKNRRWLVSADELSKVLPGPDRTTSSAPKSEVQPNSSTPTASGKVIPVEQFSAMTYLTEFGVQKWLKAGRLVGGVDAAGKPGVDAVNLELPLIKRLLR